MLNEIDHQSGPLKIIERLSSILRFRWRKLVTDLKRNEDKVPRFQDLLNFVIMVAEEVSHLVFGECSSAKRDSFSEELSSTRNGANNKSGFKSDKKQKFPPKASYVTQADRSNSLSDSSRTNSYVVCMGEHELSKSDRFKQSSQPERYKLVQ